MAVEVKDEVDGGFQLVVHCSLEGMWQWLLVGFYVDGRMVMFGVGGG